MLIIEYLCDNRGLDVPINAVIFLKIKEDQSVRGKEKEGTFP